MTLKRNHVIKSNLRFYQQRFLSLSKQWLREYIRFSWNISFHTLSNSLITNHLTIHWDAIILLNKFLGLSEGLLRNIAQEFSLPSDTLHRHNLGHSLASRPSHGQVRTRGHLLPSQFYTTHKRHNMNVCKQVNTCRSLLWSAKPEADTICKCISPLVLKHIIADVVTTQEAVNSIKFDPRLL